MRIPQASYKPSVNCDERPEGVVISLLVVHCISLPPGAFGGPWIDDLFCNNLSAQAHPSFAGIAALKVSAHLLIRRDGQLIQYVDLDKRAWHAGRSSFAGQEQCNDFSIGIELEGTEQIPYSDAQYERLSQVTRQIMARYPAITLERIVGHSDIAPDRKTDPGPSFDWPRFRALLS